MTLFWQAACPDNKGEPILMRISVWFEKRRELQPYALGGAVALLSCLAYLGILKNGFVNWDDDLYIYDHSAVRSLGLASLKHFILDFYAGNWHPLTWLSHALDYQFWGLNPFGHHLTSLFLHGLNTFLVVLVVFRLLQFAVNVEHEAIRHLSRNHLLTAAAITGFLFGIHPIHVESVAWAAERKNLLSSFFALLSLLMYLRYVAHEAQKLNRESPQGWRDGDLRASLFLFVCALMSKAMAVTLPVILLLLDWYPLSRYRANEKSYSIFIEKLPFFLFSGIAAVVTFFAQRSARYVLTLGDFPLWDRLIITFYAIPAYLAKLLWPQTLRPFYPMPGHVSIAMIKFLLPIILVTAISVVCLLFLRKQKFWFVLWCCFCIMLLPVLGVVKTGLQVIADRYVYLAAIAPFMVAGFCVASVLKIARERGHKSLLAGIVIMSMIIFSLLAFKTFRQVKVWKNGISYWSSILEQAPSYSMSDSWSQASQAGARKLSASDAWVVTSLHNRAKAYVEAGRLAEAVRDLNAAVSLGNAITGYPNEINYFHRGYVFIKMARYTEAEQDLSVAIRRKPDYFDAYYMRGVANLSAGDAAKSIEDLNKAISISPAPPYNYFHDRAIAFARVGEYNRAVADYTEAIRLNPASSDSYRNRGVLYQKLGHLREAETDLLTAQRLKGNP